MKETREEQRDTEPAAEGGCLQKSRFIFSGNTLSKFYSIYRVCMLNWP